MLTQRDRSRRFQSLLFWIIGSGIPAAFTGTSISLFQSLLFWIIGSGAHMGGQSTKNISSFNPCCFGSLVRASLLIAICLSAMGFNPCCFGSLVRAQDAALASILQSWFQSLLFWIIGSGMAKGNEAPDKTRFNPCCFGSLVRACHEIQSRYRKSVSILVVLDHWFGLSFRRSVNATTLCFNPCCFGSLVRAQYFRVPFKILVRFQSLLFWIIGSGNT